MYFCKLLFIYVSEVNEEWYFFSGATENKLLNIKIYILNNKY